MANNPKSTGYGQENYETGNPGSKHRERDWQKSESMNFEALEGQMEELGENLRERGRHLKEQVNSRIHKNPWAFIGGASVAGLAVGYLIGRKAA